ncbi:tetratricopeptide repeat protein [Candidatus Pelagibacter sp. HIMB1715]|uniref:tetratricopeptide repeat protein n=1 Tax=Candidatus Pelagibacter sp. HIMB1715 TaxID=3413369 RepID=UPI003F851842
MINQNNNALRELFNLALDNHKNKKFIKAKNLYEKILNINPNFLDAKNNLGLVLLAENDYLNARKIFQDVVETNPKIISAQYSLGFIFKKIGDYENSIKSFKNVIKINSNQLNTNYNLGLIYKDIGDQKNAEKHFKEEIRLNPRFVDAHNNLGIVFSSLGNYEEAINCFINALKFDSNFKSAKENLVLALTSCNFESTNPIVTLHNDIKKKYKNLDLKQNLKSNDLTKNFGKFNQNFNKHKKYIEEINFTETQTFRRNSYNLNCERHHELYNKKKIISKFCFGCFKIQIEPNCVLDLVKLYFVFDDFRFLKNNWRKCMLEFRQNINGLYKGFIYCTSLKEAEDISNYIKPILHKTMSFKLSIKRGCSEFYDTFPNFKELDTKNNDYMQYDPEWELLEKNFDKNKKINKKTLSTLSGLSLSDFLVINNWLNYAKMIDDRSYKKVSEEFIYSNYIFEKLSNQIEFRKKQFSC